VSGYIRWLATVSTLGILVATSAASGGRAVTSDDATAVRQPIPLLSFYRSIILEVGMPAVVGARMMRERARLLKLARGAEREPVTRASGCVPSLYPGSLGPPAPKAVPRVLGHQVEVLIEFDRLPRSWQCRPWQLYVVVHGKDFRPNSVTRVAVDGRRRGRVVVDLPYGKPPYTLRVTSESLLGRRGPTVELPLLCPGTGDRIRGCVARRAGFWMPKPVLPVRGVSVASLEASLDYLLAAERRPPVLRSAPTAVHCPSLRTCEITYADRAFPDSPFRARYRIAGQQVSGCWLGQHQETIGRKPYSAAGEGSRTLAACVFWLR